MTNQALRNTLIVLLDVLPSIKGLKEVSLLPSFRYIEKSPQYLKIIEPLSFAFEPSVNDNEFFWGTSFLLADSPSTEWETTFALAYLRASYSRKGKGIEWYVPCALRSLGGIENYPR